MGAVPCFKVWIYCCWFFCYCLQYISVSEYFCWLNFAIAFWIGCLWFDFSLCACLLLTYQLFGVVSELIIVVLNLRENMDYGHAFILLQMDLQEKCFLTHYSWQCIWTYSNKGYSWQWINNSCVEFEGEYCYCLFV